MRASAFTKYNGMRCICIVLGSAVAAEHAEHVLLYHEQERAAAEATAAAAHPVGNQAERLRRHAMLVKQLQDREARFRKHDRPQHHHDRELQVGNIPPPPAQPPPHEWDDELHALQALYASTGGSTWANRRNWLNGYPCEAPVWQGLDCSVLSPSVLETPRPPSLPPEALSPPPEAPALPPGRVRGLLLNGNSLIGTLPSDLGMVPLI